ncbi:MAG: nitrate- and nitrite sensing domain-containing protein [Pseudomonadota bacterium]
MPNPQKTAPSNFRTAAPTYSAMLLPFLGLVVCAVVIILMAYGSYQQSNLLISDVERSTAGSNLAHELQKERGMSVGFVASSGTKFNAELAAQRRTTDAIIEQTLKVLDHTQVETIPDTMLGHHTARHNRLRAALDRLAQMRRSVDNLKAQVPEVAKFYTGTIRDLLSFADDPLLNDAQAALTKWTVIYRSILMAKEFAGVERAAGSVGFGKGAFDVETYTWFNGLQQRQDFLKDRISSLSGPAERASLDAVLKSAAAQELERLRTIAQNSLTTGDVQNVTAQQWFAASTAYLGELRKFEQELAGKIRGLASANGDSYRFWVIAQVVILVAVTLLFGLLGVRYVSSMLGALGQLQRAISRIANAEQGIEIPATARKDAIGTIAKSLLTISNSGAEMTRVATAVEKAPIPTLVLDDRGIALFENAAFEELFATDASVLSPLMPTDPATGRHDASALVDLFEDALAKGKVITKSLSSNAIEIKISDKIFEGYFSQVRDKEGRRIGSTLMINDISAVRQLEGEVISVIEGVERGEFSHRVKSIDDCGFTSFVAHGLNRQMEEVERFMRSLQTALTAMSQGDLTKRIADDFAGDYDKACRSVNSNMDALSDMICSVSNAATQLHGTVGPIASGAQMLAGRAEEQAAALEETSATMEEISRNIASSAKDAKTAADFASQAEHRANHGVQVLSDTKDAMGQIEGSSSKIADIIAVIDGIAFQTNLLALNAAVEAARAGDAGKGFAVVASEVRSLAQRSSDAAKEIREQIQQSTGNVAEGVALMEKTSEALDQIRETITNLGSTVNSISNSMADQAAGAKEVTTTVGHLDQITQKNATVAQESAGDAKNMQRQADELQTLTAMFQTSSAQKNITKAA